MKVIKYSAIRKWVLAFVENTGYDGIVFIYKCFHKDDEFEVKWDE